MRTILYMILNDRLPEDTQIKCSCGWLLETRALTMTNIVCTNPNCPIHNSYKLERALELMGLKASIGDTTAGKILGYYKVEHFMEVCNPEIFKNRTFPSAFSSAMINLNLELERAWKMKIETGVFMSAFQLTDLGQTRSAKIFVESKSPKHFYERFSEYENDREEYKKQMEIYVADKLKMSSYTKTVSNIVSDLIDYKKKILEVAEWFNFEVAYEETIYIAITGAITFMKDNEGKSFKPRETICRYWKDKYKLNIISSGLSEDTTQFLVMDTNMKSNSKYNNAVARGIKVVTSQEMDNILSEMVGNKLDGNSSITAGAFPEVKWN